MRELRATLLATHLPRIDDGRVVRVCRFQTDSARGFRPERDMGDKHAVNQCDRTEDRKLPKKDGVEHEVVLAIVRGRQRRMFCERQRAEE